MGGGAGYNLSYFMVVVVKKGGEGGGWKGGGWMVLNMVWKK